MKTSARLSCLARGVLRCSYAQPRRCSAVQFLGGKAAWQAPANQDRGYGFRNLQQLLLFDFESCFAIWTSFPQTLSHDTESGRGIASEKPVSSWFRVGFRVGQHLAGGRSNWHSVRRLYCVCTPYYVSKGGRCCKGETWPAVSSLATGKPTVVNTMRQFRIGRGLNKHRGEFLVCFSRLLQRSSNRRLLVLTLQT